jgi:acetoin utilization deacetylase AcuC-like enzyme
MRVLVANHASALEHNTGLGHPERPDRARAVLSGIRSSGLEVVELEAPEIKRSELALVHDASYIEMIENVCASGGGALDVDTVVSSSSWEAAIRAAGGVRKLVEELTTTTDATGFAMTRPPGHHALRDRAMGFCVFNNVAVAAALLRSQGERVAILDWDVHHGNGTQVLTGPDPGVLYVSVHEAPFYPFTGELSEDLGRVGSSCRRSVRSPLGPGQCRV